jgi:hypothetical protein
MHIHIHTYTQSGKDFYYCLNKESLKQILNCRNNKISHTFDKLSISDGHLTCSLLVLHTDIQSL